MERKADLQQFRPDQRRELQQLAEGNDGVAPPQKIEHFLRHARAALQRPKPSGTSVASLGRARRVLVAPTSSSKGNSSNSYPDTSMESDAGKGMIRNSRSGVTDLVLPEKLPGNLASKPSQANLAPLTKQEKFESKKRKGDSELLVDHASLNSVVTIKLFSGKNGNMDEIDYKREFLHTRQPTVSAERSIIVQSISTSNHPNFFNECKVSSYDGMLVRNPCNVSHPCKSTLADDLKNMPLSSSSVMNLHGTHPVNESIQKTRCIDSHTPSSEKPHSVLSSNSLMHIDEDVFDPTDTMTSTCRSNPQCANKKASIDSAMENLSSYLSSLAFTDNGTVIGNQVGQSTLNKQVVCDQDYVHVDTTENKAGSEEFPMCIGGVESFETKNSDMRDAPDQKLMDVMRKELISPPTTASAVATATSLQCTPAAPLNPTTYNPSFYKGANLKCSGREPMGESNSDEKPLGNQSTALDDRTDLNIASGSMLQLASALQSSGSTTSIRMPSASVSQTLGVHDHSLIQKQKQSKQKIVLTTKGHADSVKYLKGNQVHDRGNEVLDAGNAVLKSDNEAHPSKPRNPSSSTNAAPSSVSNPIKAITAKEAAVSRKKHYDPDAFFKVNGKLYQKLGRIGTGGSSEVYKVISSDCTIYALKKIKLKGRDYSTACGFCQEIEYLNRLRGKNNIIQLIDFEVTDKRLLEWSINNSVTVKDGRINDGTHIYMLLEYGEIDLAHMLSRKWKEMESSNVEIDQNWLRFYWQQILRAVHTIHDERIVHSDLKPANFLLVKGSLKLIDFGIAKAIQSDTTNIQRDSQVGTLNYMSPEAFLFNEQDSGGNTIKCGRPSDIWSLGCILYQMVYGKTPFAEYKTFWAKFKVITDRNHVINYSPVSNPWLVDLMKKCLAWDRDERWRIPQLLQHPFLAPPMPSEVPSTLEAQCKFLTQIVEHHSFEPQVSLLCSQLKELIINLRKEE